MNNPKVLDRAEGAMFGSALGDAIGIYTEFMTAKEAVEVYGSSSPEFTLVPPETPYHNDSHRCRFESRAWTDDTDHAILIVLSYLRLRKLSPTDFAVRLHSWCAQRLRVLDRLPMGLGSTSQESPLDFTLSTAYYYWDENCQRLAAANGSLMRTTPIGVICIPKTEEQTFKTAIIMGYVTHADPRCALSVAIVAGLIRALCLDEISDVTQIRDLIERAWGYVQRTLPEDQLALLERDEFEKHAYTDDLDSLVLCDRSMGYVYTKHYHNVYKCLGSSLWCLRRLLTRQDTFCSAMTTLVMYGGDADTNGAVAGALMGALCGYECLPKEWRDGMRHADWYREKGRALCVVAGISEGVYDSESDQDTLIDGGKGVLTEEEMKKREMRVIEKMSLAEKELREVAEVKRGKETR
ncbi:ADP-ribosylglycohydrolase-domain-containing protein [Favolaschia claudopus]|uniref:ADP-ribosylglycohydrolase-domain-containing protein n=1 Tax=Favolaschia claudopus TaxID=2862362 RepID=A0AAW0CQG5_9AGAR